MTIDMSVTIAGVTLKNPVIAASGTFGFGEEFSQFYDVSRLGGISTKGLTLQPREGNAGIRVWETPSGMLNSVGLQNPGIDAFIRDILPHMPDTVILANVGGGTTDEYIACVEKLNDTRVDMIELNISCPNVKHGGMAFGIQADVAADVVSHVRKVCQKPLVVKLSPNAEDICQMAVACQNAGADALSLVNTFKGMAIDVNRRRAVFDNVTAGLSGPAIRPLALRMVFEVCKAVQIPVIGLGGIMTAEDALTFIMAGATAVQLGTAHFADPYAGINVVNGLQTFLEQNKLHSFTEIRGIV